MSLFNIKMAILSLGREGFKIQDFFKSGIRMVSYLGKYPVLILPIIDIKQQNSSLLNKVLVIQTPI